MRNWYCRKIADVLRRWRRDEMTMIEAVRAPVDLGYAPEKAWEEVARW